MVNTLHVAVYDKRAHLRSYITPKPAYGAYISQLIHNGRICMTF